jgi:hypothetical protein
MNANLKRRLLMGLLAAAAAFVGYLVKPDGAVNVPAPSTAVKQEAPRSFGWIPDPQAVDDVRSTLPFPVFQNTEAFSSDYAGPEDVYLWDACRKVTGDVLPARDQKSVGCCVGFGTAAAVEHLMCVQVANGSGEKFCEIAPEIIYAGSRVEIGGGKVRGDGSVGAWAAKFVNTYGVLPRGKFGTLDLLKYDERTCRDLGVKGVPDELEPTVKEHPVKSIANVRSWAEAQAAIRNGYPIAVCSSQGFGMVRDAQGFCPPQGVWYHCMALVGVRGGTRPGGFLLNSWGPNAHSGPQASGEPPGGFWADAAVLDRMLKQGDSWAVSSFKGFPTQRLDWFAKGK